MINDVQNISSRQFRQNVAWFGDCCLSSDCDMPPSITVMKPLCRCETRLISISLGLLAGYDQIINMVKLLDKIRTYCLNLTSAFIVTLMLYFKLTIVKRRRFGIAFKLEKSNIVFRTFLIFMSYFLIYFRIIRKPICQINKSVCDFVVWCVCGKFLLIGNY